MDEYLIENINKIQHNFATIYFNKVWDILDKDERIEEEQEKMIHMAHASFQHWTEVKECSHENISMGYWQLSRVYAVADEGKNSLKYADKCIEVSEKAGFIPFYIGYAYEAKARALKVLKDEKAQVFIDKAKSYLEKIKDVESRKMLEADLKNI